MSTRRIAKISISAGLLNGLKVALAFVPNVELVSAILVVYALTYQKMDSILISVLFVCLEILIYGFALYWVVLYLIYWPLLTIVVGLLPRNKNVSIVIAIAIGMIATVFFGVLSSFVEVAMSNALGKEYFWKMVYFRYLAGIPFFVVHIVSNAIVLPLTVYPMCKILQKLDKSAM